MPESVPEQKQLAESGESAIKQASEAAASAGVISDNPNQQVHQEAFADAHKNDMRPSDPALIAINDNETLEQYKKRIDSIKANSFQLFDSSAEPEVTNFLKGSVQVAVEVAKVDVGIVHGGVNFAVNTMAGIGEAVRIAGAASFELSPISALCPDLYPDKEAQKTLHSALDAIAITERITLQLSTTFNPYSPLFGVEYDPKGAEITRKMVMAAPEIAAGISSIAQGQYHAFINSDNEHKAAVATEGLLNVAMLIEAGAGLASKLGQMKQVGNLVETAEGLAQVGTATSLDVAVAKNTETLIAATENNTSLKPLADKLKDCLETLNDWTRPEQELVPEGAFLPPRDGIVDVAKDIGKDIKSFGDDVGKNIEDYINRMVRKGDDANLGRSKYEKTKPWKAELGEEFSAALKGEYVINTNSFPRLRRLDCGRVRQPYEWVAHEEKFAGDAVRQTEAWSCTYACIEMLTNGEIKEIDLLKKFRKMGDISTAEEILGPGWTNKNVKFADTLKNGPILVEMREISIGSGHHLVVDSVINNVVSIRDPWEGTRYTMSFAEFDANWTGQALYRK